MQLEKPWKDYQTQLEILGSRGMLIGNEAKALDYLERIGYYRLSGYWYSFRKHEMITDGRSKLRYVRCNEFVENSYFKDAIALYVFDKKLRLLALDALERIEMAIRVDVAYLLGQKDVYAQENIDLFRGNFAKKKDKAGRTQHDYWLENYHRYLKRSRKLPFVAHYLEKYGRLPIWVSTDLWDFGLLSRLFSGMKPEDQDLIGKKYGAADGRAFASWLRGLNFIRNVSAHHSRLWNINILERASPIHEQAAWSELNTARPFFYFAIMQKLLRVICPNSSWFERFSKLMEAFPMIRCGEVSLSDFGLPDDWHTWDMWKQK